MAGLTGTLMSIGEKLAGNLKESNKISGETFKSIGKGLERFGSVTSAAKDIITTKSPLEAGGKGLNNAGELAMMAGGPAGILAGGALKLAGAAISSVERLRRWNNDLMNENLSFSDSSPAMAAVGSEHSIRQRQIDNAKGWDQAATTRSLAQAQDTLSRQLAPIESGWANFKNQVAEALTKTASAVLSPVLGDGAPDSSKPRPITPNEWAAEAGKRYEEKVARRPKRLGGRN